MPERPPVESELQEICQVLLASTQASRTTVRLLDQTVSGISLVAEALADGVPSMHDGPQPAVREAPTYVHLERTHEILIQDDVRTDPVSPPPSLIDDYHVWAQMLAPVLHGGKMVATISVHQQLAPRHWSATDRAALEDAQARVVAWYTGRIRS
jgi:GAF domain-containing protein